MHRQLHVFLARRDEIVERIQTLLNAQRQPSEYLRNTSLLSREFEACVPSPLARELEAAHFASGFKPRDIPGLHNGPADPAELMARAFYLWRQTRWPGRNGRLRYAHTLFNLYVIRCLELASMRIWDDDAGRAGERLAEIQGLLDRLWSIRTADQPALVRDARWLIQLAQSLATDDLGAYFRVATCVAGTLPEADRIEIHKAGVRMAAGHLRSQSRYYSVSRGVPLDDHALTLNTRSSNALDFALLVQELLPLLAAYEDACATGDARTRLELADAICQGVSADPELFVNRVDLLGPYSMIEPLFIASDGDGHAVYSAIGERHVRLLEEYDARIARAAKSLYEDCQRFRPVAGTYSPYGVLYGFSSDLLKHMALKMSQPDTVASFGLEDVFVSGGGDKLAWVNGWRKLPHLSRDVEKQFEYPQPFADAMFARVEVALRRAAAGDQTHATARTGRLFVRTNDGASNTTALPARYIETFRDEASTLADRREGKYLVTYQTPSGWAAVTKAVLTDVLGSGHDATITLPPAAGEIVTLMFPQNRRPSLTPNSLVTLNGS